MADCHNDSIEFVKNVIENFWVEEFLENLEFSDYY